MKNVLMLYPIKQFVDTDEENPGVNSLHLDRLETYWNGVLNLKPGIFRERFRLINKFLEEYRSKDYNITWALFSKEKYLSIPDESSISDIFDINRNDKKVSVGVTYNDHISKRIYPVEDNIIKSLGYLDELVVGGFHEKDCVHRFVCAAERNGISSNTDSLLTEDFFSRMLRTFEQDDIIRAIETGHIDPEMHEDGSKEVKSLLFNRRLDKYLL